MNDKPTEAPVVATEPLFQALLSYSPEPVVIFDEEGTLLELSPAAERLFGFARVWALGRNVQDLLVASDADWQQAWLDIEGGAPNRVETMGQAADGSTLPVEVTIGRVSGAGSTVIVAYLRDLSEVKRSEAAVRDSEERFRKVFKDGPVGIALVAPSLQLITANDALCKMLGFDQDEIETLTLDSITHPDDIALDAEQIAQLFLGTSSGYSIEKRLMTSEHEVVWGHLNVSIVSDAQGQPLYSLCIIEDITERRRVEEERNQTLAVLRRTDQQRQDLLARLVDAQEEERRRIAADVHDDSVQIMAAAAIRLERLAAQLTDPAQVRMLNELLDTVRHSITRLRTLLFELTPTILDHEGLAAAIRAKLEELSEEMDLQYEIENKLRVEPAEHPRVITYRIISEVLANIRKHSEASKVDVSLKPSESGLLVKVTDNGKGFEDIPGSPGRHLGMSSIRERAQVSGGWSRVVSSLGNGTTVEFWIPDGKPIDDVSITIDVSDEPSTANRR